MEFKQIMLYNQNHAGTAIDQDSNNTAGSALNSMILYNMPNVKNVKLICMDGRMLLLPNMM